MNEITVLSYKSYRLREQINKYTEEHLKYNKNNIFYNIIKNNKLNSLYSPFYR